tara:strand:- start:719 stop:1048 length:330 start_codon:yes stop_codon:yes gene_type:complete
MYKQDPNNPHKQIPAGIARNNAAGQAGTPSPKVVTKGPNHVYINKVGTYSFLYESTASLGGTTSGETYVEAMAAATLDSPVRLDIQPVAWSGSAGLAKGDVTFVYINKG